MAEDCDAACSLTVAALQSFQINKNTMISFSTSWIKLVWFIERSTSRTAIVLYLKVVTQ